MANINCATDLFERGDVNVPVTLFELNPKYYMPNAYKNAWLETICNCLGEIAHCKQIMAFTTKKPGQRSAYLYEGTFEQFMRKLRYSFQKPTSIRITLLGDPDRSWIIIIPKD